ncbi:MAG TPA: ribose 5-phosphate isomerase B [Chitinophagaceae bacterium]|nr:ribose 5-phosphate isomerase B [Chitinophagaceae bacterium]
MSFDLSKPIAIGSDHAGFELKMELLQWLNKNRYQMINMGVYENKSVDYPDYAHPVATAVEEGEAVFGILICGSANGVCMTANKHKGIRAAICWETEIAKLARLHNDANVICLPARFISPAQALEILQTFMITEFEGGRHQNRVNKITNPSPQQAR